jgi:ribosomal protein S28E/S33
MYCRQCVGSSRNYYLHNESKDRRLIRSIHGSCITNDISLPESEEELEQIENKCNC